MSKTYAQLGTEIGELVERKNAAYGSSFAKAGAFLELLYPDGLQPEQYADALLLVRIFDKTMRIATDRDALGESPYADIGGYGLLGAQMHEERKASSRWQESAKGPNAESSSKFEQHDSAAPNASGSTAATAIEKTAHEPSPQPDGCSTPFPAAFVPSATGVASPSAEDQLDQRRVKALLELRDVFHPHRITIKIDCFGQGVFE